MNFWSGWYSQKFKGPGLRYEVGLNIATGDIVWINGPFPPGKWPDVNIFEYSLMHCLEKNERVETDKGYRGVREYASTPQKFAEDKEKEKVKARIRSRHETANKRLKQWGCLKQIFRHDIRQHSAVFRAVAVITQLSFENGSPLYQVSYSKRE